MVYLDQTSTGIRGLFLAPSRCSNRSGIPLSERPRTRMTPATCSKSARKRDEKKRRVFVHIKHQTHIMDKIRGIWHPARGGLIRAMSLRKRQKTTPRSLLTAPLPHVRFSLIKRLRLAFSNRFSSSACGAIKIM